VKLLILMFILCALIALGAWALYRSTKTTNAELAELNDLRELKQRLHNSVVSCTLTDPENLFAQSVLLDLSDYERVRGERNNPRSLR
jgi:hypothetical protein